MKNAPNAITRNKAGLAARRTCNKKKRLSERVERKQMLHVLRLWPHIWSGYTEREWHEREQRVCLKQCG